MATPQPLPVFPQYFTSGNQITDNNGNPIRLACIGWSGSNARNGVPEGLDQANYKNLLTQVFRIGFNCIRLTFCDMMVIANDMPAAGLINTSLNPDLAGFSCMQVHDAIITYCGQIGMKVIIDSHNNEGSNDKNFGANQPNGLWYDVGGASDGTDAGGNVGHVTDAGFLAMWQSIATRYSASSAIIGYDLRNEPNTGPNGSDGSTWGDGSNQDIRAMYQRVGNAILAIDPKRLIICEGIQHYSGTYFTGVAPDGIDYGNGTNWTGASGDLSIVRTFPVVLNIPNKVVYSVHEYPPETSGDPADAASAAKITQMTAIWGYLVKENKAPIYIGEMGSFLNGTAAQVAESTAWANMMVSYCNGTTAGGPVFTGAQQGISTDWWVVAVDENPGGVPSFGILTAWTGGVARSNQYNIYSQLFYFGTAGIGTGPPPVTASANNTTVPPAASITDNSGNVWTIISAQVAVNGVADTTTFDVIELAWVNGTIWLNNLEGDWYFKVLPTDSWTLGSNPFGTGAASPDRTVVTKVNTPIIDNGGNSWTINVPGQVAVNGVADPSTPGTLEIAWVSGLIWRENTSSQWFWTNTTAPNNWTLGNNPLATASPNGTVTNKINTPITDANGNVWTIQASGQVAFNGVPDATAATATVQLGYFSGLIYRQDNNGQWWRTLTPGAWIAVASPLGGSPVASPNGTIVTGPGPTTGSITDANGNVWTITIAATPGVGTIAVNGVNDVSILQVADLIELAFVGNQIWIEHATNLWQFKTLPGDTWKPVGGTATNPLSTAPNTPAGAVWNIHNGIAAWTGSATMLLGARRSNNGVAYQCVLGGITAANGGPMGTGSNILDGTARWAFLSNIDFTDRSGAFASLPVTFSQSLMWLFWNDASQTTTAAVPFLNLIGHTMGTNQLTLTAAPQDGLRTYLASQSRPLTSTTAATAFLEPQAVAAAVNYLIIADPTVVIDGLTFIDPTSASGSTILITQTGNTSLVVRNCIFDGYSQPGGATMIALSAAGSVLFANCLFIDRQPAAGTFWAIFSGSANPTTLRFVNCTFVAVNSPSAATPLLNPSGAGYICRNCAFFGYGGSGGYAGFTLDHCATDQANFGAGIDGGNNLFNLSMAATFVNPLQDFRLLGSSALLNAAVTDLADIPAGDDISALTRKQGAAWDIGCWERLSYSTAEIRPQPIKFW
jgi:hypothetical protein